MNLSIKKWSQSIALGLGVGLGAMGPVNEAKAYKTDGAVHSRIENTVPKEVLGELALGSAAVLLAGNAIRKKDSDWKSKLETFLDGF